MKEWGSWKEYRWRKEKKGTGRNEIFHEPVCREVWQRWARKAKEMDRVGKKNPTGNKENNEEERDEKIEGGGESE